MDKEDVVHIHKEGNGSVCCSVVSNSLWPHGMPGSSVLGILQARILEWVAIPVSRGSSRSRDRTPIFCIAARFFTIWATRQAHIYTMEYYSAIKEWNDTTCSNMDGPTEYYTKWSKSERERKISCNITYMWNLKYDTNEPVYKTENRILDIESRLIAKGKGEWERD